MSFMTESFFVVVVVVLLKTMAEVHSIQGEKDLALLKKIG